MIYECAGSVWGGGTQNRVSWCRSEGALLVSYLLLLQYHVSTSLASKECWLLEINETMSANHGAQALSTLYFQVAGRLINSTSIYLLILIIFTTNWVPFLTTSEEIQHSISPRGRRWLVYLTLLARIGRSSDDLWVDRTEVRKWPRLKILLSRVSVRGSTYC